jgi:hypothetical protein
MVIVALSGGWRSLARSNNNRGLDRLSHDLTAVGSLEATV